MHLKKTAAIVQVSVSDEFSISFWCNRIQWKRGLGEQIKVSTEVSIESVLLFQSLVQPNLNFNHNLIYF